MTHLCHLNVRVTKYAFKQTLNVFVINIEAAATLINPSAPTEFPFRISLFRRTYSFCFSLYSTSVSNTCLCSVSYALNEEGERW